MPLTQKAWAWLVVTILAHSVSCLIRCLQLMNKAVYSQLPRGSSSCHTHQFSNAAVMPEKMLELSWNLTSALILTFTSSLFPQYPCKCLLSNHTFINSHTFFFFTISLQRFHSVMMFCFECSQVFSGALWSPRGAVKRVSPMIFSQFILVVFKWSTWAGIHPWKVSCCIIFINDITQMEDERFYTLLNLKVADYSFFWSSNLET